MKKSEEKKRESFTRRDALGALNPFAVVKRLLETRKTLGLLGEETAGESPQVTEQRGIQMAIKRRAFVQLAVAGTAVVAGTGAGLLAVLKPWERSVQDFDVGTIKFEDVGEKDDLSVLPPEVALISKAMRQPFIKINQCDTPHPSSPVSVGAMCRSDLVADFWERSLTSACQIDPNNKHLQRLLAFFKEHAKYSAKAVGGKVVHPLDFSVDRMKGSITPMYFPERNAISMPGFEVRPDAWACVFMFIPAQQAMIFRELDGQKISDEEVFDVSYKNAFKVADAMTRGRLGRLVSKTIYDLLKLQITNEEEAMKIINAHLLGIKDKTFGTEEQCGGGMGKVSPVFLAEAKKILATWINLIMEAAAKAGKIPEDSAKNVVRLLDKYVFWVDKRLSHWER